MYKYFDVFGIQIQNEHKVSKAQWNKRGQTARQSFNEMYDMCIRLQDELKPRGMKSVDDKYWRILVWNFAFLSASNIENVKRKIIKDL